MAKIIKYHTTQDDKILSLGIREARRYKLNLGTWATVRVGALVSGLRPDLTRTVPSSTLAQTTRTTPRDWALFGLKASGDDFPGENGMSFVGIRSYRMAARNTAFGTYLFLGADENRTSSNLEVGSWQAGVEDFSAYNGYQTFGRYQTTAEEETTSPATLMVLEFAYDGFNIVVKQRMAANTADAADFTSGETTYLESDTLSEITNATLTTVGTIPWTGTLPSEFFLYLPFTTTRLCLHAVGVQKIS
jgi:hypothetical protein